MITVEVSKEPDSNWNKNLLRSKYGTIFQTVEYAQYVKSRIKSTPIYVKFNSPSEKLVGQLLLFQSFKGRGTLAKYLGKDTLYLLASKISSSIFPKYTYWSFGPVIFDMELQTEISESLGYFLTSWKGNFQGSIHPLYTDFEFSQQFKFQRKDEGTFIIDLQQDLGQILDKTDKKSVKKNIERSQNRGVTITQISSGDDLNTYFEILNQHRQESRINTYSIDDVILGYDLLKSVGQIGFLAWQNNVPVGGIFASTFNGFINEWGIARTKKDAEEKLYSQDLLRWKIIEWGKENNCSYYDLSGVKIKNRDSKEEGIFRNKEKWGGKLIVYPSFSN